MLHFIVLAADLQNTSVKKYDLRKDVVPILQEILSSSSPLPQIVYIPPTHLPPASLEGSSVVYVLHIFSTKHPHLPGVLYVGESESLTQRLRQHRMFYKRADCQVVAVAWNVADKSSARQLETQLIGEMKKRGFIFDRDSDASHSLFSRGLKS